MRFFSFRTMQDWIWILLTRSLPPARPTPLQAQGGDSCVLRGRTSSRHSTEPLLCGADRRAPPCHQGFQVRPRGRERVPNRPLRPTTKPEAEPRGHQPGWLVRAMRGNREASCTSCSTKKKSQQTSLFGDLGHIKTKTALIKMNQRSEELIEGSARGLRESWRRKRKCVLTGVGR